MKGLSDFQKPDRPGFGTAGLPFRANDDEKWTGGKLFWTLGRSLHYSIGNAHTGLNPNRKKAKYIKKPQKANHTE